MEEWTKDKIIPSIIHGSAAKLSFMTDYMNTINVFATKKDVDQTAAAILKAAKDANSRNNPDDHDRRGRRCRPRFSTAPANGSRLRGDKADRRSSS